MITNKDNKTIIKSLKFDYKNLNNENPVYQILYEIINNQYNINDNGFLFFLICQTGIGKTYVCIYYIFQEMLKQAKKVSKHTDKTIEIAINLLNYIISVNNINDKIKSKAEFLLTKYHNKESLIPLGNLSLSIGVFINDITQIINLVRESNLNKKTKQQIIDLERSLMQQNKNKISCDPIAFITNTRDNVKNPHDLLVKMIENDKTLNKQEKDYLKNQIILLNSNSNQLKDNLADAHYIIDKIAKEDKELQKLYNSVKENNTFFQKSQETNNTPPEGLQKDIEEKVRELYNKTAKKTVKFLKKSKTVNKELTEALYKLFPAYRFLNKDAHVLFMTTDKFFRPINGLVDNFTFTDKEYCNNLLLFIDEVDKQHAIISKILLDLEVYYLIRGLKTARTSDVTNELEKSAAFAGVDNIMTEVVAKIKEISDKYDLQSVFDCEEEYISDTPLQLFSSSGSASCFHISNYNKKDDPWIELIPAKISGNNKNIIKTSKKKDLHQNEESKEGILYIINQLNSIYNEYLQALIKSIKKILENKTQERNKKIEQYKQEKQQGIADEKRIKVPNEPTLEECTQILFRQYNLDGIEIDIQKNIEKWSRSISNYNNKSVFNSNFHNIGYILHQITRNNASTHSVEFKTYSLQQSSTGCLVNLVKNGAKIIGISATADAETVIHNFDCKALKQMLGSKFIELNKQQMDDIYKFYCAKRNYENNKVKVIANFLTASEAEINKHYKTTASRDIAFNNAFFKQDIKYVNYMMMQTSLLLQAISIFAKHPTNRYMLSLTTRNFGANDKEQKLLKELIANYEKKFKVKITTFYAVNADKMNRGIFKEIETVLTTTDDKVLLLSSYESMGFGKNPDYPFNSAKDKNRLVFVDDTGFKMEIQKTDIDTIYLNRPTNLYTICNDKIQSILYNLMCQQQANQIDALTAKKFIRYALNNEDINIFNSAYMSKNNKNTRYGTFKNNSDYNAATRKIINQATGRSNRTPWKSQEILVMADNELVEPLAQDNSNTKQMSHEYYALVQQAKKIIKNNITPAIIQPTKVEQLRIFNLNTNKRCLNQISIMLNRLFYKRYIEAQDIQYIRNLATVIEKSDDFTKENIIANFDIAINKISNDNQHKIIKNKQKTLDYYTKHTNKQEVKLKLVKSLREAATKKTNIIKEPATSWFALRAQLLMEPTILNNTIKGYNDFYIQTIGKKSSYRYIGTPELECADQYQIDSDFKGCKNIYTVSAEDAQLDKLSKNPIINEHFRKNNYALTWIPSEHLICPAAFTNIYRPAISEQICQVIFPEFGLLWEEMPLGFEEWTDGIIKDAVTGKKILIDAKFYNDPRPLKANTPEKIKKLMQLTGIDSLIIINLFKIDANSKVRYLTCDLTITSDINAKIIEVPGLLCNDNIQPIIEHIIKIKNFINR